MADIFISYSREDRSKAELLAKFLQQRGWSVWWDRVIPVGKSFDQIIERELDAAKCVIVLWSKSSISSNWVRVEAAEGANRQILIPIIIEDVKIPLEFRRLQTANLVNWRGSLKHLELQVVIESITELVGKPTTVQPKKPVSTYKDDPSFTKTEFQTGFRKLLDHAKTDFKDIKGIQDYDGKNGYISYKSKISLKGAKNGAVWRGPGGKHYFTCDFAEDVIKAKAEAIFESKSQAIRSVLSSQWKVSVKINPKESNRKEFTAVSKTDQLRIILTLYIWEGKDFDEKSNDVDLFIRTE